MVGPSGATGSSWHRVLYGAIVGGSRYYAEGTNIINAYPDGTNRLTLEAPCKHIQIYIKDTDVFWVDSVAGTSLAKQYLGTSGIATSTMAAYRGYVPAGDTRSYTFDTPITILDFVTSTGTAKAYVMGMT